MWNWLLPNGGRPAWTWIAVIDSPGMQLIPDRIFDAILYEGWPLPQCPQLAWLGMLLVCGSLQWAAMSAPFALWLWGIWERAPSVGIAYPASSLGEAFEAGGEAHHPPAPPCLFGRIGRGFLCAVAYMVGATLGVVAAFTGSIGPEPPGTALGQALAAVYRPFYELFASAGGAVGFFIALALSGLPFALLAWLVLWTGTWIARNGNQN